MRAILRTPWVICYLILLCALGLITLGAEARNPGSAVGVGVNNVSRPLGGGTATPTATCGPVWAVEQSPNVGNAANKLAGVDSLPNGTIWAVGSAKNNGSVTLPVAQYWNGSGWVVTATPAITESGFLTAVAART